MDQEGSIRGKMRDANLPKTRRAPPPPNQARGGKRAHCHRRAGDVRSFERPTTRRMQGQSGKRVPVGVHSCRRALVHLRRWAPSFGSAPTASTPARTNANARPVTTLQKLALRATSFGRCAARARRVLQRDLSPFPSRASVEPRGCMRACVAAWAFEVKHARSGLGMKPGSKIPTFHPLSQSSSCFWPAFLLTLARIDQ
jgi:hypothetical protein